MAQPLFDSHCHFDFSDFDGTREQIWQACLESGIQHLMIPGVEPAQWPKCHAIAEETPHIYYAAGLHPWWMQEYVEKNKEYSIEQLCATLIKDIKKQAQQSRCLAVGECGLDKFIDASIEMQLKFFHAHCQAAQDLQLPLIVHSRKTHNEILSALKNYSSLTGVIHAFSGSAELAQQYWEKGFRLGVGGSITYERAKKTREAVQKVPHEAIVLETDAPDMPLNGFQGQSNSPIQVKQVAETLAQLRGESLPFIAKVTTDNALKLFSIN